MRRTLITLLVTAFALLGGTAAAHAAASVAVTFQAEGGTIGSKATVKKKDPGQGGYEEYGIDYVKPIQAAAAAKPKPKKLTLSATSKVLTVGQAYTIKVKSAVPAKASKAVKWSSSNRKVATVSASGKIKALKPGKATIKATSKVSRKVTAKLKLTVRSKSADPNPAGPTPTGPGTPTEPTAPPVIDPKLVGSWTLLASGAGTTVTYYADGTWDQVIIFRGSITNLEVFTKGKYRAEGGKLFLWDIVTSSRKDDSEPWSEWKPAAEPTRTENYVVGTDEIGEYLVTEPDPKPVTEESVKYRRR